MHIVAKTFEIYFLAKISLQIHYLKQIKCSFVLFFGILTFSQGYIDSFVGLLKVINVLFSRIKVCLTLNIQVVAMSSWAS